MPFDFHQKCLDLVSICYEVKTDELPNYLVPPFDGIGSNEYIVAVTHEVPGPDGALVPAVDFMSAVDTPYVWELNMWYHTLNAGFRTRLSGETDFPCIYAERVGLGRAYVKLDGALNHAAWCEGSARAAATWVTAGAISSISKLRRTPSPVKNFCARAGSGCALARLDRNFSSMQQLGNPPHPAVRAHQPDLDPGRGQTGAGFPAQCGMVSPGGGMVLVAETAFHQGGRTRAGVRGLRPRTRGLPADSRRMRHGLRQGIRLRREIAGENRAGQNRACTPGKLALSFPHGQSPDR